MSSRLITFAPAIALSTGAFANIKRTPSGKPDLSGVYDTATLTPTERPEWLGATESLYPWFADLLNWTFQTVSEYAIYNDSDGDRKATT